jgi:hypothetical protein
MVAECSNPSCSASFRSLKQGRLFRLESDPPLRLAKGDRVEYFWLCQVCSSTMTLRLQEDGTVVTVLFPDPTRGLPDGVTLTSTDRANGLWLRSVSSLLPDHFGSLFETRLKSRQNAAAAGRR